MSLRTQVLGGYRRLLRASQQAFQGDVYAIQQAGVALRENFVQNKNETNSEVILKMIQGIEEAESMLLHHIVQGKQVDTNAQDPSQGRVKYKVKLTDPQKQHMRKDEELTPITPTSADEPLVINSGNVCQRA